MENKMNPLSILNRLEEKNKFQACTFNYINLLDEIRSIYILKSVFNYITESQKLNLIKYNKKLQKKLEISFKDNIVIDLTIKKEREYDARFINPKYEKYCFIYFNNNLKRIKRNYVYKNENVSKIKLFIYDNSVKSLNNLFYECECIEEIKFIKFNRKNIDINELSKIWECNFDFSEIKINNE